MELRSAHFNKIETSRNNFKVGAVVLIGDDTRPRQTWKYGVIVEVHQGRDGKIRSCSVRSSSGAIFRRPIQLLYNLELNQEQIIQG